MAKEIVLTKGKVAVVDDEDHEMLVSGSRWCVNEGYAFNATRGRMHRVVLNAPPGVMVDHINGDKLDNRKANLRLCTNSTNQANRKATRGVSKFKGVVLERRKNGRCFWKATLVFEGKAIYLGSFATDLEAAAAYNEAAVSKFGEFAHLNDLTLPASEIVGKQPWQSNRKSASGYKGVTFDSNRGKWIAQLTNKRVSHLHKRFATAIEAAKAYDEAARRVYGPNAVTNF